MWMQIFSQRLTRLVRTISAVSIAWLKVGSARTESRVLYILQQAEILPKELPEGKNPNRTTLKGGEINGQD